MLSRPMLSTGKPPWLFRLLDWPPEDALIARMPGIAFTMS